MSKATFEQLQAGAAKYIDVEIVSKISGWQKWVLGAACALALNNSKDTFGKIKEHPFIAMLDVISPEGEIDIERLHSAFRQQATQSGATTFNIPLVGGLTLNETDIDKLYQYVKEASNVRV